MNDRFEPFRLAALGDLHVTETDAGRYRDMFLEISDTADVLALCGDLTNFGKPCEAEILAEDLRTCSIPCVAVLGNHDHENGQADEVCRILRGVGVTVLHDQAMVIRDVGFAGVKGFLGGFGRGELGAFGEPSIKTFVDVAIEEARRLENALRSLKTPRSIAVLHYAPIAQTLLGEPLEIYPFLGCSRLADAIDRFENVAAVVHGHAHRGVHEGRTPRGIPVYNCAQMVVQKERSMAYALIEI